MKRLGTYARLSYLLEDSDYIENINTVYAATGTILWSLRLDKSVECDHLLSIIRRVAIAKENRTLVDALALYLSTTTNNAHKISQELNDIFSGDEFALDAFRIASSYRISDIYKKFDQVAFETVEDATDQICTKLEIKSAVFSYTPWRRGGKFLSASYGS